MGYCIVCKSPMSFNPHHVLSINVNGFREPVCMVCMAYWNERRKQDGLPIVNIHPDAYEPLEESEL